MFEEYPTNSDGLVTANGTWTYKIPTVDTIPKQFNVELLNSGHHKNRVLSSKGKFIYSTYYVSNQIHVTFLCSWIYLVLSETVLFCIQMSKFSATSMLGVFPA